MSAGEEQGDDFGLWLFYLFFCSSKVEKRTSLVRFVVRGVWPQQDNWGSGTHSLWVKNPHSTCDLGSGGHRLFEWLRGGFFRGVFAAVSGNGHFLYFSGPIKHSENASIPSVLWSHYYRVVKHEFISPSFQGLCSALTANTIRDVCGRGNPSELDGQRVLMGHHRFSFLGKG